MYVLVRSELAVAPGLCVSSQRSSRKRECKGRRVAIGTLITMVGKARRDRDRETKRERVSGSERARNKEKMERIACACT